jgi:hypothetical protein
MHPSPHDQSVWRRGWPLVAVAVVCVLPLWGLWRAPGAPMEEGFMLVFPERVLHGAVPNRDFLHLYGPGSLWVLAGVFKVLGTALTTERAVGYLQQLGVVFAVLTLLRPWGRWVAAAGAATTAMIIIPPIGLTALAWVGALALGLWSLHLSLLSLDARTGSTRQRRLLTGAGLLAAAALLYRPDLVLAVGASGVVITRGLDRPGRRRFALALGWGLTPYVLHTAIAGPGNVIRGLIIEPVFTLRGGRRLPLPPSWSHFDGFLQRAGVLAEPPWPLPAPPSPSQLSLWLGLLVAANAVLLVGGVRAARRGDRRLLALAVFSVGLLPQALQRADSTHLAWVSCIPLGLLPAGILELLRTRIGWPARRRGLIAAAAPAVLLLALVPHFTWRTYGDYVAQSLGRHRSSHTIERDGRVFYYGRPDAVVAVTELLAQIDHVAKPGDALFVGTGDLRKTPYSEAFLYYLLPELRPATRYIEMDPGVANAANSGLADELASADIVILSSIRDDWVEPNDSRVFGPDEPNQVLARDFCKAGSFGKGLFGRGLYELYARC